MKNWRNKQELQIYKNKKKTKTTIKKFKNINKEKLNSHIQKLKKRNKSKTQKLWYLQHLKQKFC